MKIPENIQQIIDLYQSGKSAEDISIILNKQYSGTSILRLLRQSGIIIRPNSRAGRLNKHITKSKYKIEGQRFGKLVVGSYEKGGFICKCDCGYTRKLTARRLLFDNQTSCGCEHFRKGNKHHSWKGYNDIPLRYFTKIKNDHIYRGRYKQKKLEFNVTIEYLWGLYLEQDKKCRFTGVDISFENKSASLDRIDSTKGYIEGNVQWVHKDVNIMKWNKTDDDFIAWCKKVTFHCKNL